MKKILFRGKTKRGNWVYGSLIVSGKYCCILEADDGSYDYPYPYLDSEIGTIDGCATPVIPETIGRLIEYPCYDAFYENEQIFEGDIIAVYPRVKCGDIKQMEPEHLAIVVNEDCIIEDGGGYRFPQDTTRIKVVGNVIDNPELIGRGYAALYLHNNGYSREKED